MSNCRAVRQKLFEDRGDKAGQQMEWQDHIGRIYLEEN